MIKFQWDVQKNNLNQEKHKISFETAQHVFLDSYAVRVFDRIVDGETRWHMIGNIMDIVVVLVVYTERDDNIRIISARKANTKEKRLYYANQQKNA